MSSSQNRVGGEWGAKKGPVCLQNSFKGLNHFATTTYLNFWWEVQRRIHSFFAALRGVVHFHLTPFFLEREKKDCAAHTNTTNTFRGRQCPEVLNAHEACGERAAVPLSTINPRVLSPRPTNFAISCAQRDTPHPSTANKLRAHSSRGLHARLRSGRRRLARSRAAQ